MSRCFRMPGVRHLLLLAAVILAGCGGNPPDSENPIPDPTDRTFHLPVVVVDTGGVEIPDEPKIPGDFLILPPGRYTPDVTDAVPVYAGHAGIELRGSMSQALPKKQYGIELQEIPEGETEYDSVDVPLLDLPEESDWVLNGTYLDRTLIRNVLAYELSRRMGQYASRYRWVELVVNDSGHILDPYGQYLGVYALLEKIKRGSDRVAISKLNDTHNAMPQISGGYILKIDNEDPGDYAFATDRGTRYIVDYPKPDNITGPQKAWIEDYVEQFEDSLGDETPAVPYGDLIEAGTFADFFLLNELFKNVDAYRYSTYLHKDRSEKLRMGPVWDFDLAAGNCRYYRSWDTAGWMLDEELPDFQVKAPFWWRSLLDDPVFYGQVQERWAELRAGSFSSESIETLIDDLVEELGPAIDGNFERWEILGEKLPLVYFTGASHAEEIDYLKDWLSDRAAWMDEELNP